MLAMFQISEGSLTFDEYSDLISLSALSERSASFLIVPQGGTKPAFLSPISNMTLTLAVVPEDCG